MYFPLLNASLKMDEKGQNMYEVYHKFIYIMLRRIFGPSRDEVTGDWRRLHNEELNDLYCSPDIVRVIK